MLLISPSIPFICITPAPPVEIYPDPHSPFPPAKLDVEDDGYRANWLQLPPSIASSPWYPSSLRPADRLSHKGLSRHQFNTLLQVSRDQRAKLGSQRTPNLRPELALENQSLKQFERRTRFLFKVNEPSGGTPLSASDTPLAPQITVVVNSPVIAGCDDQMECGLLVDEQRLLSPKSPPAMPNKWRRIRPSLDEITARLKPVHVPSDRHRSRSRLPDFLTTLDLSSGPADDQTNTLPVRSLALNDNLFDIGFVQQATGPQHPDPYNLTLGSRHANVSYAANALARPTLHSRRVDTAQDMIVTLSRRSSSPPGLGRHGYAQSGTTSRAPGGL